LKFYSFLLIYFLLAWKTGWSLVELLIIFVQRVDLLMFFDKEDFLKEFF